MSQLKVNKLGRPRVAFTVGEKTIEAIYMFTSPALVLRELDNDFNETNRTYIKLPSFEKQKETFAALLRGEEWARELCTTLLKEV